MLGHGGEDPGAGSGSRLPPVYLITSGVLTLVSTAICTTSIVLQLKSYRKPILQRQVVRIMGMVPIYAIASLISLFSLEAAFVIDAIRDLYEAFVIYCFFNLLLAYIGGERATLILLYGRPPKQNVFPASLFKRELDLSDPFTFLSLKRGILQYVQIKPLLAIVTLLLKSTGNYNEGDFRRDSGYLYVSIVYNLSVCIALYSLAMFWVCIHDDIKPFRPVPKFLCVKGVLFACFWQSIVISFLVAVGAIKHVGPYKDAEHISLAISDTLICFEMPIFAIAHFYAFAYTDYIDPHTQYAARMPFYYALRDAFGIADVIADSKATFRGGVSYQSYEPVEGGMHQGSGRDRRIQAGLRYAKGGKKKYWLPMPDEEADPTTSRSAITSIRKAWDETQHGYAPLVGGQADDVIHEDTPRMTDDDDDGFSLVFGTPTQEETALYEDSRNLLFGDYNYPAIDVSGEDARLAMWKEEERILSDERAAAFTSRVSPMYGYGATGQTRPPPAQPRRGKEPIPSHGVYGGWAERRSLASSRRDTLFDTAENYDQIEGPAVVDLEHDRVPSEFASPVSGIKLVKQQSPRASPREYASVLPGGPRSRTSSKPTPSSAPRTPGAFTSRLDEINSKNLSTHSLPSDAVDLVVEDLEAAEREMTWERRKGETAVRTTALRKVYKTIPYKADGSHTDLTEDGDGEVGVRHGSPKHPGEARGRSGGPVEPGEPEPLRKTAGRDGAGKRRRHSPEYVAEDPGRTTVVEPNTPPVIAVDIDPPQDARVEEWSTPKNYEENENPWA